MISKSKVVARYAETDQMGIVHHSVYPIRFELARTDLAKQAGFPYSKMEEAGIMTPLVELHCKYRKPAHYEDELIVTATVSKLSPVKVEFSYEVFHEDDSKPICTGSTVHALVSTKDFRIVNAKKEFPEIYGILESITEKDAND